MWSTYGNAELRSAWLSDAAFRLDLDTPRDVQLRREAALEERLFGAASRILIELPLYGRGLETATFETPNHDRVGAFVAACREASP